MRPCGRLSAGIAKILDGVAFGFGRGELVSLLGANGAGKSTLLRMLLGLLPPQSGSVTLDGLPLRRMGGAPMRKKSPMCRRPM